MKVTLWFNNGDIRTVDFQGPMSVSETQGTMDILHDHGTGWDYYFNKDGSFDGTARFTDDLSPEEAKGLMQGLKEMNEGRTKPFEKIREELKKAH